MSSRLLFCLSLLLLLLAVEGKWKSLSALHRGPWKHEVVEGERADAPVTASFRDDINISGWSFLKVVVAPDTSIPDEELAYTAGLLEGRLTAEYILMHWKNTMATYCATPSSYCSRLRDYIDTNAAYVRTMVLDNFETSPYWNQVHLFNRQFEGLQDGYAESGLQELSATDFLFMLISGDLDDLEAALGGNGLYGAGSCSALVKLLPGNADLFVSHDTWDDYHGMLRIFKMYDLPFYTLPKTSPSSVPLPGSRMSFSSYPGVLLSGDDYYLINSGLVTMETTIGNSNDSLWQYVTPTGTVFEGVRSYVANRLSSDGKSWCSYFSMFNSGTYNNQWMVVDYKLFTVGDTSLKDGLLWVLEQIPGLVVYGDQTDVLRKQSYWPSYNIAFYPTIFNTCGGPAAVAKFGPWFSYDGAPRAKMFARDHSSVTDLTSMIKLMRYNDFEKDPLAKCNCTPPYSGENGISARSDLNPANGTYPFGALAHRCHGGTDSKGTSVELFKSLSCYAISGPTYDQQPPFRWSTADFGDKPLGQPDLFVFQPVLVSWD